MKRAAARRLSCLAGTKPAPCDPMFTTGIVLVFLRDTFKDVAAKLDIGRYVRSPSKRPERNQYSAPVRA
jgi:hypothetical protein